MMLTRRAEDVSEHGDRPLPPGELGPYLDDLERLNAWFGGYALSLRAIRKITGRAGARRRIVIADIGGARGGLATRLIRDARRRGRAIKVVVVDRDAASLAAGRRAAEPHLDIAWLQADAGALPLRDGAVDVATMSLTLHHLDPESAVVALGEMRRATRAGVVVNDLLRTWIGYALVWLATRLFARHPFSRDDGPLSVRRAYSADELRQLASRAGLRLVIRRHPVLARLTAYA